MASTTIVELLPSPADVASARKWQPPPSQDGIAPSLLPEWLRDDALPFLELFDRHVASNPSKLAMAWVNEVGKATQHFTYKQVSGPTTLQMGCLLGGSWVKVLDRWCSCIV